MLVFNETPTSVGHVDLVMACPQHKPRREIELGIRVIGPRARAPRTSRDAAEFSFTAATDPTKRADLYRLKLSKLTVIVRPGFQSTSGGVEGGVCSFAGLKKPKYIYFGGSGLNTEEQLDWAGVCRCGCGPWYIRVPKVAVDGSGRRPCKLVGSSCKILAAKIEGCMHVGLNLAVSLAGPTTKLR